MPFASLGLGAPLCQAAQAAGFTTPTPIQAAAVPAVLAGHDVWATAHTGSGKTAAYALPLLQRLEGRSAGNRSPRPARAPRPLRALVLVPTRELADQVGQVLEQFAHGLQPPVKRVVVYGGVSVNPQMMRLRGGSDLLVATPGRLLDLIDRNALTLAHVRLLVLDEADRLLDAGFADEVGRIVSLLPPQRQTLLFSATFAPAVQSFARAVTTAPVCIDLTDAGQAVATSGPAEPAAPAAPLIRAEPPAAVVAQRAFQVDPARRMPLLRHLVRAHGWQQVLVFVATQYATEHLAAKLAAPGLAVGVLHGALSQGARQRALMDFKVGRLDVLIATDLAARGLDIRRLPVVVNYDLPRSAVDFVHRTGRTGRAGADGLVVSFVTPATEAHFRLIEKRQGQRIPRERVAGFEPAAPVLNTADDDALDPLPAAGGVKGRRKSKKDKLREAAALRRSAEVSRP